jgi:hypothetical protein
LLKEKKKEKFGLRRWDGRSKGQRRSCEAEERRVVKSGLLLPSERFVKLAAELCNVRVPQKAVTSSKQSERFRNAKQIELNYGQELP